MLQSLLSSEPLKANELVVRSGLDPELAKNTLDELMKEQLILEINHYLFTKNGVEKIKGNILDILDLFHHDYPLRLGMPQEELRSKARLSAQ